MRVNELTRGEQVVLVALARHLVSIDGELSDSELYDLIRLGVEIGKDEFEAALTATEAIHRDRALTLAAATEVTRPQARDRINTELDRIARGDGLHAMEDEFLGALRARWGG